MTREPEQIRADIDRTRAEMEADANRLTEKVTPSKVVERRVDGIRESVMGAKEKVTGAAGSVTGSVAGGASSTASGLGSAAGTAHDSVVAAPGAAKQKASGSPLVAGAVAFGVGYLVSALLPSSEKEQQLASQAKDTVAEPLKETLKESASEVKEQVAPQAAEAAQAVKDAGTSAAQTVKETATSAAGDVKDTAAGAAQEVRSGGGTSDPYPPEAAAPLAPPVTAPLGQPGY